MWYLGIERVIKRVEWFWFFVAVSICVALTLVTKHQVRAQLDARQIENTNALVNSVQRHLNERVFILEQMATAWSLVARQNSATWQALAVPFLDEYTESPGLVWAPLIADTQRAEFERRFPGGPRQLIQYQLNAPPGPAQRREQYAPLLFIGGRGTAEDAALGFDLLSEPTRALMLNRAQQLDKTVISQPLELVTHRGQNSVLVAKWVSTDTGDGYVVGAYLLAPLFDRLLDPTRRDGQLFVLDPSTPDRLVYPYGNAGDIPATPAPGMTRFRRAVTLGERDWQVIFDRPLASLPLWPNLFWILGSLAGLVVLWNLSRARRSERVYQERLAAATAELITINQSLVHKNAELESFAYAASHDLQAPLRGIRNITQWIREDTPTGQLPAELSDYLHRLSRLSQKMSGMITGLLQYSRATSQTAAESECSIQQIVSAAQEACPELEVKCESTQTLFTRASLLQRTMGVLLHNAQEHNPNEPKRCVVFDHPTKPDTFLIADNGRGIREHQRDRIFEIFQTLEKVDEDQVSGLGLPIARKLALSVSGQLQLSTYEHGRPEYPGACFELTWPSKPMITTGARDDGAAK